MPGQSLDLNTDLPDQTVLVEGWHPTHWPHPQLANIRNNKLQVINTTHEPVILSNKKVNSLKVTKMEENRNQKMKHTNRNEHTL